MKFDDYLQILFKCGKPKNTHYLGRVVKLLRYYKEVEPNIRRKKGFQYHHILPKNKDWYPEFIGDRENKILLPARIHLLVHHLMMKAFPQDTMMMWAFYRMSSLKKFSRSKLTGKAYAELQEKATEYRNTFWTAERRATKSAKMRGSGNNMYGKRHNTSTIEANRISKLGKHDTPETRKAKSEGHKDRTVYTFQHPIHGILKCTRAELQKTYPMADSGVDHMFCKNNRPSKGWIVLRGLSV